MPPSHGLQYLWGKILVFFIGIKVNIHGYENIKNKRYIFCSNHSSVLDIPIALSIIYKPLVFLAKKQLFNIPFFGLILSSVGMIKVNRENKDKSKESIDHAINIIKESYNSILIYPEGTRADNNILGSFKKGCFIIAIKSRLPILPLTITGAGNAMPKSSLLINKEIINIYFHKEISTDNYSLKSGLTYGLGLNIMTTDHIGVGFGYSVYNSDVDMSTYKDGQFNFSSSNSAVIHLKVTKLSLDITYSF